MRELHTSGVTLTVLLLCRVASLQNCAPGLFGPDCQYASHCPNASCGLDFTCPKDSMCAVGWFGPGCQYVDLVASSISKSLLNNGYRCRPANEVNGGFGVRLISPYVITWIRIEVAPSYAELNISIGTSVETTALVLLKCKQIRLTETVVDVFCEPGLAVQDVIIRGPDAASVCSFFISGGRNVALKQETWQSSTQSYDGVPLESWRAVDGNTNGYLRNTEKSCSNTASKDKNPVWGIKFKAPKRIYQVVLHNRDAASLLIRLKGFTLTCYSEGGTELFSYTDSEDTPLEEYVVHLSFSVKPVTSIVIRAAPQPNENNSTSTILSLCEVEIYGDSVCPQGTFGFECEHMCNCSVNNKTCVDGQDGCQTGCNVGLCLKACQEGWTLPESQRVTTKSTIGQYTEQHRANMNGSNPAQTDTTDNTAEPGIIIFIGVGVGIAVLASIIIIIIVVVVAVRFSRRKTRTIPIHVYDVTSSNGHYNHEYNVNFKTDTSSDETRLKRATPPINDESQLYDEVNDGYVEFE